MKSLLVLAAVVLLAASSCLKVAGRWRPQWNAPWSRTTCTSSLESSLTVNLSNDDSAPARDFTVVLSTHQSQPEARNQTDERGVVTFSLAAGEYNVLIERTAMRPLQILITQPPSSHCVLDVFLGPWPTITLVGLDERSLGGVGYEGPIRAWPPNPSYLDSSVKPR